MLTIEDDDDASDLDAVDNDAPPGPDGPTHVTRELECVLSAAEIKERGQVMASEEREVDRLKQRRKNLNAQIRGKLDHMTELAIAIDSGKEVREVACTWRPDYQLKHWELQRDDTLKVINVRAMTSVDLQTRLPLESATAAEAAADGADDDDDGAGEVGMFDGDPVDPDSDDDAGDDDPVDVADPPAVAGRGDWGGNLLPAESTPEAVAAMAPSTRRAGTHPNGLTEAEHAARDSARKRATKPAKGKNKAKPSRAANGKARR